MMNYDYSKTSFSKALLAGVFAGILAVCLSLLFNGYFREFENVNFSGIINVSTIIFSLILFLAVIGLIYHWFVSKMKQGNIVYQLLTLILFVIMAIAVFQVQRTTDSVLNTKFQELLLGITIITGLCAVLVIPFFYRRNLL